LNGVLFSQTHAQLI